jgi:hypothetical protein
MIQGLLYLYKTTFVSRMQEIKMHKWVNSNMHNNNNNNNFHCYYFGVNII